MRYFSDLLHLRFCLWWQKFIIISDHAFFVAQGRCTMFMQSAFGAKQEITKTALLVILLEAPTERAKAQLSQFKGRAIRSDDWSPKTVTYLVTYLQCFTGLQWQKITHVSYGTVHEWVMCILKTNDSSMNVVGNDHRICKHFRSP